MSEQILIVDDQATIRNILREILSKLGYQVWEAVNGSETLEQIKQHQPDLILLDILLPDIDGIEVLRQVRKTYHRLDLPVIMISSEDSTGSIVTSLNEGANDYICKPINPEVLAARVETSLACKKMREELQHNNEDLERRVAQRTAELIASNISLNQEIDTRNQFQTELQHYKNIVRFSNDLMSLVSKEFVYKAVSDKYCQVFNKPEQEIVGHKVVDIHGEEVFNTVIKPALDRCFSGEEIHAQHWIQSATAGQRFMDVHQAPLYHDGEITDAIVVARDITEQLQSQNELRRYQHIVSAITEQIAFLDTELKYKFANEAYLQTFDYTADDVLDKPISEILGADLFGLVGPRLKRCLKGERINWQRWTDTSQGKMYIDIVYNPYHDEKKEICGVVVSIRDITSVKEADEALRKYEQIVGASSDLMSFVNREFRYLAVNQKYLDAYQKPRQQIIGHTIDSLVGPEAAKKIRPNLEKCFAGSPVNVVLDMNWLGETQYMEVRMDPYRNTDGFVTGAVVNVRNVSERIQADSALRALAQTAVTSGDKGFLNTCVETLANVYQVDYAVIAVHANHKQNKLRTLAVWNKDGITENFSYLLEGSPCLDILQFNTSLISNNAAVKYPKFNLLKELQVESYFGLPLQSVSGEVMGVVSVMHTKALNPTQWTQPLLGIFANRIAHELQHKWAAEERERLLTVHRATLESAADAIVVIGEREALAGYNKKFVDMWKMPQHFLEADDGFGVMEWILTQLKEPEILLCQIDAYFLNRAALQTNILECKDGRLIERFAHPYLIDEKIVGRVVSYRDITARKQAEAKLEMYRDHLEELVRARTIELEMAIKEIESFSYSVSHDLRSPLRAIDGYSRILMEDYQDKLDDTAMGYLQRSRAASQRMGSLIDDLLVLSRLSRRKMRYADIRIDTLATSIFDSLKEREPERDVIFKVENELQARGDNQLLRIALENLISNAWKYSSKKAAAEIEFGANKNGKDYIYFIKDNGVGFDMEYANNIFKAFFRLHGDDEFEGTGIGLATTSKIIERHGGRIWAEGKVDEGATFYFTLPYSG